MSGSANGGRGASKRAPRRSRRREPPPLPRRPYRDSALLHGVLALVIVGVSLATGGSVLTGVLVALAYFVLATTWSWMRFSQRLKAAGQTEQAEGGGGTRRRRGGET